MNTEIESNFLSNSDTNSKVILDDKHDIMLRYIQLRRLAISYWDVFSFSFGYCLIFPLLQKLSHNYSQRNLYVFSNIVSSFAFSYFFYKVSLKHFLKMFNQEDYNNYKTFCLKYQLEDELLKV